MPASESRAVARYENDFRLFKCGLDLFKRAASFPLPFSNHSLCSPLHLRVSRDRALPTEAALAIRTCERVITSQRHLVAMKARPL